jgi:hypothetical protein
VLSEYNHYYVARLAGLVSSTSMGVLRRLSYTEGLSGKDMSTSWHFWMGATREKSFFQEIVPPDYVVVEISYF